MDALTPCPSRRQRKAAIASAAQQKEQSRRAADHAARVRADIARIADGNGFIEALAEQIMQRHSQGGHG